MIFFYFSMQYLQLIELSFFFLQKPVLGDSLAADLVYVVTLIIHLLITQSLRELHISNLSKMISQCRKVLNIFQG